MTNLSKEICLEVRWVPEGGCSGGDGDDSLDFKERDHRSTILLGLVVTYFDIHIPHVNDQIRSYAGIDDDIDEQTSCSEHCLVCKTSAASTVALRHRVAGADSRWLEDTVTVTIADNDEAGVVLSHAAGGNGVLIVVGGGGVGKGLGHLDQRHPGGRADRARARAPPAAEAKAAARGRPGPGAEVEERTGPPPREHSA